MMRTTFKYVAGLTLAGALAVATAAPSQARWHHWQGAAAGFAAGALVGAAAANSAYYGPDYYYAPGYAYAPGYDTYAYAPGITYPAGTPMEGDYYAYDNGPNFGPHTYNYGANADSRHCGVSPASSQAGICSP